MDLEPMLKESAMEMCRFSPMKTEYLESGEKVFFMTDEYWDYLSILKGVVSEQAKLFECDFVTFVPPSKYLRCDHGFTLVEECALCRQECDCTVFGERE